MSPMWACLLGLSWGLGVEASSPSSPEELLSSMGEWAGRRVGELKGDPPSPDQLSALLTPCEHSLLFLAASAAQALTKAGQTDPLHNWALEAVDSFGRPKTGLTQGNVLWLGRMDVCEGLFGSGSVNVSIPLPLHLHYNTSIRGNFTGHYVQLVVHAPQAPFMVLPGAPFFGSVRWGMCLPAVCNTTELDEAVHHTFASRPALSSLDYQGLRQPTLEEPHLTPKGTLAIVVLSLLGFLVLLGTVLRKLKSCRLRGGREWDDLKSETTSTGSAADDEAAILPPVDAEDLPSQPHYLVTGLLGLVRSFGVQSHWERISGPREEWRDLRAVEGVRVLSSAWLILGHTYYFALPIASNPLQIADPSAHGFAFQFVLATPFVADSFYLLSGTLLGYGFLRRCRANPEKLRSPRFWLAFYGARFVRVLQPYMLFMLLYVGLNAFFGSGPVWPQGGLERNSCKDTLWTNLLFVNNLVPVHFNGTDGREHRDYCALWTWYLSNEMQFFVLSPLFLVPLGWGLDFAERREGYVARRSWTAWGLGALGLASAAATLGSGLVSYEKKYPPNPFPADTHNTALIERMSADGYGPAAHAVCFLFGIFLGWSLLQQSAGGLRTRLHRVVGWLGWAASIAVWGAIVFGVWPEYRGEPFSPRLASFYSAGSRVGWAMSLGWVVYACARGRGGFLGRVLEARLWLPLSRLSYVAYLIHPAILMSFYYSRSESLLMDDWSMALLFCGFFVLTYLAAFFVSAVIESPILNASRKFRRFTRLP